MIPEENFAEFSVSDSDARNRMAVRLQQTALNEKNAGKVDADGNEYVPIAVDGVFGSKTEAATAFVAAEAGDTGTGDTGTGDTGTGGTGEGAQKEPADNVQDKKGNWLYIQNAAGAWYNNPAFIHEEEDEEDEEDEEETETEKETRLALEAEKQKAITLQLENDALRFAGEESSADILADLVQRYGLPSTITDFLTEQMIAGESELGIAQKIRARPEYAARFPGMAVRRELNLPTISESEYIGLERSYRTIMRAANLPANFHDGPEDFTNLISGDVSAQEFQQRVGLAESALDTANQDIITQLRDFYDLSDGDLTAYYLDPKQAQNVFEQRRMYEAAGLSVAATQSIGEGLEVGTAEALQRENIQRREIQSRLGQRAGLTEDLLGSEGMSATQVAEAEFGLDVDEATRLRRLREARLAPMMGGGSALTTAKGVTGLGAAE